MSKKKELHILYIITQLELGGAQKVCLSLFEKLRDRNATTFLIAGPHGPLTQKVTDNPHVDLIPELQGRFPIRVELAALTADDFERILTEPNASLTEQYQALMATEGLNLSFNQPGIRCIAESAWQVNEQAENIGARRLQTVMEKMLERISFEATERGGETIHIDEAYAKEHLIEFVKDEDLSHYIL